MVQIDCKANITNRRARQVYWLLCRQQRRKLPRSNWENLKWMTFVLSCVASVAIGNASIASPTSSTELGELRVRQLPIQSPRTDTNSGLGILRVRQLPIQSQQNGAAELGTIRVRQLGNSELGKLRLRQVGSSEIGRLRVRQLELQPPKPQALSPRRSQPIVRLLGQIGYFQTNNIFSGVDPINGGLVSTGLALWATPALGPKTSLVTAIDGSLIAYVQQSEFNYNQIRFRAGIRQNLAPGMYGEIGWNNQQLFRATAGGRFFNENSIRLALYRRDRFTDRLRLDSFYEFRLSLADPSDRSRIINSLLVSLSYYVQNNLQVGIDYQFGLSEFTRREREDQYHRLLGRLTYSLSRDSQVSVQGGLSLGGSSDPNINFNDFFFSVSYTVELGKF